MDLDLSVDNEKAIERLMRYLRIEGTTGNEAAIGAAIFLELKELGVRLKDRKIDTAFHRIPLKCQTGNHIVTLPGTRPGPRRLFSTHLDTVPLCAGAVPVRKGGRIESEGHRTALGGDNRTGCAALVTMVELLLKRKLPHPPLTVLFTVREESGLFGARYVDPADLGDPFPSEGYNIDGRMASMIVHGAVGAERWEVEIKGRAAHAGVAPQKGISATAVASLAIADVYRGGWFGRVEKDGKLGTSNVGPFGGGDGKPAGSATNVVTDYVHIQGESRSHDPKFAKEITQAYKQAFESAAEQVRDDQGRPAGVTFRGRLDYSSFRLKESHPVVKRAQAAARRIGREPLLVIGNGGLDANWLVKHKVPTVTFGAGQNEIHTVDEWVDLDEFVRGCQMALALATAES